MASNSWKPVIGQPQKVQQPQQPQQQQKSAPLPATTETPQTMAITPIPKISEVHVDGVALMRIIKHCNEEAPTLVAGVLLGLEVDGVLEVTNCFPAPQERGFATGDDDEEDDGEVGDQPMSAPEFSLEMMKKLRAVNVDNNTVGWYRSTQLFGSFIEDSFISEMMEYHQKIGPNSICLVFDPFNTGSLALRAFRLRPSFISQLQERSFKDTSLDAEGKSNVLDELPVRLTNSKLAKAFLWDMQEKRGCDSDFSRLGHSTDDMLAQNMDFLNDAVDDMIEEQESIANHLRRNERRKQEREKLKKENEARISGGLRPIPVDDKPLRDPNRFNALLHGNRIDSYCKEINALSTEGFSKAFLTSCLQ